MAMAYDGHAYDKLARTRKSPADQIEDIRRQPSSLLIRTGAWLIITTTSKYKKALDFFRKALKILKAKFETNTHTKTLQKWVVNGS